MKLHDKEIAFSSARSFSDIFKTASVYRDHDLKPSHIYGDLCDKPMGNENRFEVPVGPYCSIHNKDDSYTGIYVEAHPAVIQYIQNNMLPIERDSISFQIVEWKDDTRALVLAQYSLILGDRYLAIIDASTIVRPTSKETT